MLQSRDWTSRAALLSLSGKPSVSYSCSFVHKNQNFIVGGTGDKRKDYLGSELLHSLTEGYSVIVIVLGNFCLSTTAMSLVWET